MFVQSAQAATHWAATETKAYVPDFGATRTGSAPDSTPLRIAVGLKLQNRAALDEHLRHITTVGDPQYGIAISREQFADSYAPAPRRAQEVADYLQRAGFKNVVIAANRLLITADGTLGAARTAFSTDFANYKLDDGRTAFANLSDARVPDTLADVVSAVVGLQSLDVAHTFAQIAGPGQQTRKGAVADGSGNVVAHQPIEFGQAYGVSGGVPLGTGYAAGIVADGNLTQTLIDFGEFISYNNTVNSTSLSVPVQVVVPTGSSAGSDTSGTIEWDLDSQSIVGMSGGVQKLYIYAGTTLSYADLDAAFNQAVVDNDVKVVNVSIGACETSAHSSGWITTTDAILAETVAQGQSFFFSSGDAGSRTGCYLRHGLKQQVSYPASSPYVVAVGGTTLSTDNSGNYVSESVWVGSGGGISQYETAPSWQVPYLTGQRPKTAKRGVPDIAVDADPASGAQVIYDFNPSKDDPAAPSFTQVGGTSLASPLSVGAWTRVWSYFGDPTYFFPPYIYAFIQKFPAGAHDVTTGCDAINTQLGYCATIGWDYASGFGSWNIHVDIFGY
jgi:subtilase family serine protease